MLQAGRELANCCLIMDLCALWNRDDPSMTFPGHPLKGERGEEERTRGECNENLNVCMCELCMHMCPCVQSIYLH